jgi:hypothetical protein
MAPRCAGARPRSSKSGLSNAGEVLLEESWHAIDGTRPGALERVAAALADISRLGPILRERGMR